jgi:hypothetical protein
MKGKLADNYKRKKMDKKKAQEDAAAPQEIQIGKNIAVQVMRNSEIYKKETLNNTSKYII